jgi:hypothetical protein
MSIDFALTAREILLCEAEATLRHEHNKSKNRAGRLNGPQQDAKGWQIDVAGAIGEMAVAKYLGIANLAFGYNDKYAKFDLPPNIDVKTSLGHNRRLPIFLDEDPLKLFVFVTYAHKLIRLQGWILGANGMKKQFIDNPIGRGDSYYVPKFALNEMSTLENYLKKIKQ